MMLASSSATSTTETATGQLRVGLLLYALPLIPTLDLAIVVPAKRKFEVLDSSPNFNKSFATLDSIRAGSLNRDQNGSVTASRTHAVSSLVPKPKHTRGLED